VLLAFTPPEELNEVLMSLPNPMKKPTPRLISILEKVRERGYEMKPSARTAGITDIGYPIRGLDKRVVAALTIPYLGVLDHSLPTTVEQTRSLLSRAARKVSEALGSTS
jgi:DNA-binding IclR family transcriptional regulator